MKLTVSIEDGKLAVVVHDTGPGFTAKANQEGSSVGLENVRRRLELCYGVGSELNIHHDEGGTAVSFRIPAQKPLLEVAR